MVTLKVKCSIPDNLVDILSSLFREFSLRAKVSKHLRLPFDDPIITTHYTRVNDILLMTKVNLVLKHLILHKFY